MVMTMMTMTMVVMTMMMMMVMMMMMMMTMMMVVMTTTTVMTKTTTKMVGKQMYRLCLQMLMKPSNDAKIARLSSFFLLFPDAALIRRVVFPPHKVHTRT